MSKGQSGKHLVVKQGKAIKVTEKLTIDKNRTLCKRNHFIEKALNNFPHFPQ